MTTGDLPAQCGGRWRGSRTRDNGDGNDDGIERIGGKIDPVVTIIVRALL